MKKLLSVLLVLTIMLSLSGCACVNVLDITQEKNNLCAENKEYLKTLDTDVNIAICSTKDDYVSNMEYFAQAYYGVTTNDDISEWFEITQNLLSKYKNNKHIDVEYVDPQSTQFTTLANTCSDYELTYGDMIVTATVNGKERVKVLKFEDIYVLTENTDTTYYAAYSISGNKLETALTSAIAYVTSTDSKKVAILSGHSSNNFTDNYIELLEMNNYDIAEISGRMITSISSEYDAVVIAAPTMDFTSDEIEAISEFLDNNGKLGKGLIYFADASCPVLPNLNAFLLEWGISVQEGIVFETDSSNHITDSPTTIGISPAEVEGDDITNNLTYAIANYNVPMKATSASYGRKATALMQTSSSAVIAPVGSGAEWAEYTSADKRQFDCVIQSVESGYGKDNGEITSYVMAFSSVEFIDSDWAQYSDLSNDDIVIACTDRACHMGDFEIKFIAKVI